MDTGHTNVVDHLRRGAEAMKWVFLFLSCVTALGALIDPTRIVTWQGNVGIPGGIPNSSNMTVYVTVSSGNMNQSYLQTQIDACPSNQVIQLPSGLFNINGTLNFALNHGVVFRGAGINSTILSNVHLYLGQAAGTPIAPTISSGSSKDSTSIVVSSATGFRVGDFMVIEGGDDPEVVILPGTEDNGAGQPAQKQVCAIAGISGTTITFTPPLAHAMLTSGAYNSQALKANIYNNASDTPNFLAKVGVENMALCLDSSWDYGVDCHSVAYCWFLNVQIWNSGQRCLYIQRGFQCEANGCFFHDSTYSGPYGYGVTLEPATACLIANNISSNMTGSFQVNEGSCFNVFAYNYVPKSKYTDPLYTQPDFQNHSLHPLMNLWEGNYGFMFYADDIHGSSSHHTVFRNRLIGYQSATITHQQYCVGVATHNKFLNFVANILGDDVPGAHMTHYITLTQNDLQKTIFALNVDGGGTDAGLSVFIHGNYDSVTNAVVWDAYNSTNMDKAIPNSLYLTSRPSWWGSALTWPPYNISNITIAALSPTNIPAGWRSAFGTNPPDATASSSGTVGTGIRINGLRGF